MDEKSKKREAKAMKKYYFMEMKKAEKFLNEGYPHLIDCISTESRFETFVRCSDKWNYWTAVLALYN